LQGVCNTRWTVGKSPRRKTVANPLQIRATGAASLKSTKESDHVCDSAGHAVETSLRAVTANPGVVAGWGLRVDFLLVLGALPAFIGLAVVLPVLGYATWHLYTRMVQRG